MPDGIESYSDKPNNKRSDKHQSSDKFEICNNSTQGLARTLTQDASIDTPVKTATKPDTETKNARKGPNEVFELQPKYLWHNLWAEGSSLSPTTAEWSEMAAPLPHPPLSETSNPILNKAITDNPDLFQMLTPIKVDIFESLLKNHPNLAFVQSVCAGL